MIRSTFKKIAASVLALAFVFSLFSCKAGKAKSGIDALPAETLVAQVDGYDVRWDQFYYFANYIVSSMISYASYYKIDLTDWTAEEQLEGTGKSYQEYAIDNAYSGLKWYIAIYQKALELGITVTEELQTQIDAEYKEMVNSYGTEESALAALAEQGLVKSAFLWLLQAEILYDAILEKQYGENYSGFPDDKTEQFIESNDFLRAKHILLLTSENDVDFDEEKKAEVLEATKAIIEDLKAYDGEDFDAYFSEIMAEKSEDPGSVAQPDGYVFTAGEMVDEFFNEAKSLGVGEFSAEPVKTTYGYHIVYRLPLLPDDSYTDSNNVTKTLRARAAATELDEELNDKCQLMTVEQKASGNKIKFEDVFVKPLLAEQEESSPTPAG
ncbi:MAG: peptidylprolyl isomerase [Oscillospiraceae bacterium]|nr:peptidylprolyl isomerase [Oscillospiraceae bacterium]